MTRDLAAGGLRLQQVGVLVAHIADLGLAACISSVFSGKEGAGEQAHFHVATLQPLIVVPGLRMAGIRSWIKLMTGLARR